jgi:hypothetical protein
MFISYGAHVNYAREGMGTLSGSISTTMIRGLDTELD